MINMLNKYSINLSKNRGFTLAEVLITLGVIGVIAAMTIPTIIQKYHNHVVETKLKKIYTVMNQAMRMSELDNGDRKYWHSALRIKSGIEQYILPYIKYTKIEEDEDVISIYFADGSILRASKNYAGEYMYYTIDRNKCKNFNHPLGTCAFLFMSYTDKYYFEGYYIGFDSTKNRNLDLNAIKNGYYGCNKLGSNCTTLIQYNGWKIPDDYPYKVR